MLPDGLPRVLPWARRRLPLQGALINAVESLQGALDSVQVTNYKEALKSYQVIFFYRYLVVKKICVNL